MILTFDTSVLVYAFDSADPAKRERARELLRAARDSEIVLTAQMLGEFVNVFRRKLPERYDHALRQAQRFRQLFPVLPSTADDILRAAQFSHRHRLQLWDCVIWQVARSAGASVLLSEDLQDGLTLDGMTVVNPFDRANDALIRSLFAESSIGDAP